MDTFVYENEYAREISFPLGGIGAGCIGLGGDGRLIDWEIMNRPNKRSRNGFSSFVVRTEREDGSMDVRALQGPVCADFMGAPSCLGSGMERETCAGWPHFERAKFVGDFPVARLDFTDPAFAGQASLTAFNPFIPLNDFDSSLPVAMFEIELKNDSPAPVKYSVFMTVRNLVRLAPQNSASNGGVLLGSASPERDRASWGELFMAGDASDASAQVCWYRGKWFDGPAMFWNDLNEGGRLRERDYQTGGDDHATLAAYLSAAPGETARVRFALSWYFPNQYAYWHNDAPDIDSARAQWRNYYATQFDGAESVARYALKNYDRLYAETRAFRDALYSTSMPREALNAVSANISLLKSPTCLRLENGSFYGWEGVWTHVGSCEGTCTHVWNYAYALAYLFPKLERSIREEDYKHNLAPDGRMGFRMQLPLGSGISDFRACCDGQFGGIIKTYREWRISGDTEWLKRLWPGVKLSLEYAWSQKNLDRWDINKDGVLEGRQHHTLDMELFGPNSWLTGMYLAALKAASIMARALGEEESAREYQALFERGREWTNENLFNGEYFYQKIDLNDRAVLEAFADGQAAMTGDVIDSYWNAESGEIKYQVGEGSAIDQVLGQWHADLVGLGDIFESEKLICALQTIYEHNYKPRLGDVFNPCRLYGLENESGALICAYPKHVRKPKIAVPYAEETMHGFEYQAASHMIMRGMEQEGLELVRGVRDRYDGRRRNPWNEMECGSNYARSMASYALLLAYSGFRYDAVERSLKIAPVRFDKGYRAFFSTEGAWGECAFDGEKFEIRVAAGSLTLNSVTLPGAERVDFESARVVEPGAPLTLTLHA